MGNIDALTADEVDALSVDEVDAIVRSVVSLEVAAMEARLDYFRSIVMRCDHWFMEVLHTPRLHDMYPCGRKEHGHLASVAMTASEQLVDAVTGIKADVSVFEALPDGNTHGCWNQFIARCGSNPAFHELTTSVMVHRRGIAAEVRAYLEARKEFMRAVGAHNLMRRYYVSERLQNTSRAHMMRLKTRNCLTKCLVLTDAMKAAHAAAHQRVKPNGSGSS